MQPNRDHSIMKNHSGFYSKYLPYKNMVALQKHGAIVLYPTEHRLGLIYRVPHLGRGLALTAAKIPPPAFV